MWGPGALPRSNQKLMETKILEKQLKIGGFAQILTLGLVALEARGPPHQDVLQGGLHHLIGLVEAAGLVLLGVGGPEGEEEEEEAVEEVRPHGGWMDGWRED